MLNALTELLASFGIVLPPWGMPVVALSILLVLLPFIWKNLSTGKARKLFKRASMFDGPERLKAEQAALDLVQNSPPGLLALAEEAERRGRHSVARQALARLGELGKLEKEAHKLRRKMAPDEPKSAVEAALVVERLLDAGMWEEAERRLQRFRRRWPSALEWVELQQLLDGPDVDEQGLSTGEG